MVINTKHNASGKYCSLFCVFDPIEPSYLNELDSTPADCEREAWYNIHMDNLVFNEPTVLTLYF